MPRKIYIPTKTAVVQAIAADMQKRGEKVSPSAVLKVLAERGVAMAPSQCARAIAKYYPRKKVSNRGIRYAAKVAPLAEQTPTAPAAEMLAVPKAATHIMFALKFVKDCGGLSAAKRALNYLTDFVEPSEQ